MVCPSGEKASDQVSFGMCPRRITGLSSESPMLSYPGLFMMLLMAWSFQAEDTFSIWVTSLFQSCVVLYAGATFLKQFVK